MAGKTKEDADGHKTGQFIGFRYKARKKGDLQAGPNEASPTTAGGAGMTSTSQTDAGSSPIKFNRHRFAGKRCQAPKGDGICGTIISARNPHTDIPVCQPCAARLCDQAREAGHAPDIEKIWRRLESKKFAAEKAAELAARASGVRATPAAAQGKSSASTVPAKEVAG